MNLVEIIHGTIRAGRYLVVLLLLIGLVGAQTPQGTQNIVTAMQELCRTAITILGAAIVLLIVMAALVYGAGQIMGAETRARATVWATAMITGVVIGAILYIILPWLIGLIINATIDMANPCNFQMPGGTP